MFHLRQRIETQLAVRTLFLTTGGFLLSGGGLRSVFGTGRDITAGGRLFCGRLGLGKQRTHLKQMLLLWIRNVPLAARTIHPAAKHTQFVERLLMLFAKLIEIRGRAAQNLLNIAAPLLLFCVAAFHLGKQSLLLCHQSMAFCKVAGEGIGFGHESRIATRESAGRTTHRPTETRDELVCIHSQHHTRRADYVAHAEPWHQVSRLIFLEGFSNSFAWFQQRRTGRSSMRKSGPFTDIA